MSLKKRYHGQEVFISTLTAAAMDGTTIIKLVIIFKE